VEVDAVILAGAPAEPDMVPDGKIISRAMVQIGPKTMLQWMVDALKSSESIGRIVAVGEVSADGLDEVIKPGISLLENIMLGVGACDNDRPMLVLSSDIPMLTPESVDDFVKRALSSGGDMCYPIISKEACIAKHPGMKRTYLKLKEGTFTGGNIMLFSPGFLQKNQDKISDAYAARKKPLTLAGMVGFSVLVRVILAQTLFPSLLPISLLERAVSKVLAGKVVAIQSDYPEIGEDVDKSSDLKAVRGILGV
jgi:GTP:adenosylcobinamide-phosphate guanylyltransferase